MAFHPVTVSFAAAVVGSISCGSPAAEVSILALDVAGHAVAGVAVYSHDEDGLRVDDGTTDVEGRAQVTVPTGGAITTHDSDPNRPADQLTDRWYTVLGVEPGDDVAIPIERRVVTGREFRVTYPRVQTGWSVWMAGPCVLTEGGPTTATLRLDERCPDVGTLVATTRDGNHRPVSHQVMADVDLTVGTVAMTGMVRPPAGTLAVDLTGFADDGGTLWFERDALIDGYVMHTDMGSMGLLQMFGTPVEDPPS